MRGGVKASADWMETEPREKGCWRLARRLASLKIISRTAMSVRLRSRVRIACWAA